VSLVRHYDGPTPRSRIPEVHVQPSRHGSLRVAALVLAGTLGILTTLSAATADPGKTGYPNSMASTGDSITRAFETCPMQFTDCPMNSWSTGENPAVDSFYTRILSANSLIGGHNPNDAVSGARMTDLNNQVMNVNGQHVELVTILMGANDVCTSNESTMTSVSTFTSQFQTAMNTLSAGSPDARIAVGSIPDIYQLWSILHTNSSATTIWLLGGICQSMLQYPTSMAQVDIDRRARVRQRNIDFNTQLQQVCAQYIHCRFDNNAAFNTAFTPSDVSTVDYFHPSLSGQALGASVGFGATFDFTDNVAPASSASASSTAGGISVSLGATDNVGVSGIEYKIDSGVWVRYASELFVPYGSAITYRAVDVNGNIEATNTLPASFPVGPSVGGTAKAPDLNALPPAVVGGGLNYFLAVGALAAVTCVAFCMKRRRTR
jgi:lysophospholipase L1-like esterase